MALVFGKYEKIRRIAQGGMGEVFLARQTGVLDRLAILKALRVDLAKESEFVEQFLDEARVAATLNHPNIVAIYDVGEWHSTYYIAMEYIAGEDLSKLWYAAAKAGIGLPFQVSVRIIMEAAMGLDHAHRAKDVRGQPLNIVHRDVSPQNLMVRADGVTKLVDFGIAKAANKSSRTQAGMVKGKLQYMSPEQVRGEPLDGRSDQFSLGIVLWEMCTGRRLFKADTEINTLQKILQTPIPRPTQHVPGFPAELEAVIMRMLERDPDKRFPSLNEVAQKLKDYLDRSSVASGETGVAAFVQQILGKELDARIADLTPMEPTEASVPPPPPPKKPEPAKKPAPQPLFDAVDDGDDDIDEPTAVLAPEQRPDRHTRPTVDTAVGTGLESLAVGPRGEWAVRRVDGRVVHFSEWAALQQQCLEGKLGRDDQVTPDGRRYTRLGDDVVLARFFDAAAAAGLGAHKPAPVPVDPAPSPATATNQRAVVDTLPVGDVISVDVSATDAVPVVVPLVPANVVAGSQADPLGGPVDPFNPNATSAFSLGALPSTQTGAWQFNGNMAALQASAVAGSSTTAPTTTSAPPPKKRAPVALWAALGVGMSLVVIGVGLRVLAPDTMAAILGERQQVPSFARTSAALTVIHSDEPAAVEAMLKELAPQLGAEAVDVDV
ncbi:MAG TPA: serine/threonine-protein kinase, partial [Myxococcota bacterium]